LTTTHDGTGPIIPDFEKDARSLAAYDEARVRYERREASDAAARTRNSFTKKRDAIRAEIAAAASILGERRITAEKALKTYANRYPQRVERNKPMKPSIWESLLSLGSAGRMFNLAVTTAADAVAAQTLRRRKEHDEEELEQQLKRALYLQEDAIKKKFEGPEGLQAFHARPGVGDLFTRVEEIKTERARYAQRLEKGEVPATERRDREFAERKISQLEVPFAALTIVGVARYGDLSYYLLRDLERKVYHLTYDPRLEPLIENVVDVYRLADSFETKLSRGVDGRPLAVADHYAANFEDAEVARSEYRRSRTALRAPRTDIPPMTSLEPDEARLVELLATFARTVGPSAMAHVLTPPPS
jgi:hypothetical protein